MTFAVMKPWREIPAGFYVLGGGRWFEVMSNVATEGNTQTVCLRHEERRGTFTYPADEEVRAKPGPRAVYLAEAIKAFADPFEVRILEDKPPWND